MVDGLVLFAITEALFSASPGPAVAMVVAATMAGGMRTANAAVFGVLLGNTIYFVISCGLILSAAQYNDELFFYIKIIGAGYLLYLISGQYFGLTSRTTDKRAVRPEPHKRQHFFKSGLTMQLANPKTILFFSAFLPQFVDTRYSITLQLAIMAVLSWVIEYAILIAYIIAAGVLMGRFKVNWGGHLEHVANAVMVTAVGWGLFAGWH